jgi:hypothetical protein
MVETVDWYLIHASWFFLGGWSLLLVLACVYVFRHDWS